MTGEDVTLVRYDYTGDLHADTDGFNGGSGLEFAAGSNTLEYTPTSGYMWVGVLNMLSGCDLDGYPFGKPASMSVSEWISLGIADQICVICYCRTVEGVESWCGEAWCNVPTVSYPDPVRQLVKQSTVCDGTFTCTDGVISGVSFYDPNFGSLCCGCDGLPCGGGSQIGGQALPEECEEGGVIDLSCCGEVPDTLTLTVTDITPGEGGGCDCLVDAVIVMTWSAANAAFMGSFDGCSSTLHFTIYCAGDPSEPRLFVTLEPYPTYVTVYSQVSLDCDDLAFGGVIGISAPVGAVDDCLGSIEITIS